MTSRRAWAIALGLTLFQLVGWRQWRSELRHQLVFEQARQAAPRPEALPAWREKIPTARQVAQLSAELPDLARRHGLQLPAIRYEPSQALGGAYQRLGFACSVSGPYAQVRRFIYTLETRPDWLAIERLALRQGAADQVVADLQLAAYLR
jgi:Tfp pilus assembly protein PilO